MLTVSKFNPSSKWLILRGCDGGCYAAQKQLSAEHASYAAHHPDLRALLSDFIQHLLIDKPTDVLDFCAQYFDAFSAGACSALEVARESGSSGRSVVVDGDSGNVGPDGGSGSVVEGQDGFERVEDSPNGSGPPRTISSIDVRSVASPSQQLDDVTSDRVLA